MPETRILTLCDECAKVYSSGYKVKLIPGRTTTEKKRECEACRKKLHSSVLKQYTITRKG